MLTEFTDLRECLSAYLQQRLSGLDTLGASTVSNNGQNFYSILATELLAADIGEGTLAKALATLTAVPDPHKVALRGAYRYVQLEPNELSKLTYAQLQNIRETVLRTVSQGLGSSFQAIVQICTGAGAAIGFKPTKSQVRAVLQYYLDLGVIRVTRPGPQSYYGIT